MEKKQLALIILDGWGITDEDPEGNAFLQAKTPFLDKLIANFPWTSIKASGEEVGLPPGQMGNSEVGHIHIGAGRVVYQELTRINKAVEENRLQENETLNKAFSSLKKRGGKLHLLGLLSDGGVHSSINHLKGLLRAAGEKGIEDVNIHAILDGRDTPPQSGPDFVEEIELEIGELGFGKISTLGGRYYYMDRDRRWDRTEKAYRAMVYGDGLPAENAHQAVKEGHENEKGDEFVIPRVINEKGTVENGDLIIFFNFRADRARQLTRAFTERDFSGFDRGIKIPEIEFVTMTSYDEEFQLPVLFPPQEIKDCLGEWLSKKGKTQLRLAETEKYAHVTFFFNGGEEKEYPGEKRCLVPSPKVATYDKKPEMSAYEVTEKALEYLEQDIDILIINYANFDMVGHTGFFDSAVKAVETVDNCMSKLIPAITNRGGVAIITSDHGNVEKMRGNGGTHTAHTSNPVPLIICNGKNIKLRSGGGLKDIAPTVLDLMEIEIPSVMTGKSLIEREG